jgi:hypothetical protein
MRHMLDTEICIYAINERPAAVLQALRNHETAGLGISKSNLDGDPLARCALRAAAGRGPRHRL